MSIAVDDIGAIAAKAFTAPEDFLGRTIPLVGDVTSTRVQAATLSRVPGRDIRPGKLPGIVARLFLGRDLYRMFRWADHNASGLPFSIGALRSVHPRLLTFEDWCRHTFPV